MINSIGDGDRHMIRRLVDRFHVADTVEKVQTTLIRKVEKRNEISDEVRDELQEIIRARHEANAQLYNDVMRLGHGGI